MFIRSFFLPQSAYPPNLYFHFTNILPSHIFEFYMAPLKCILSKGKQIVVKKTGGSVRVEETEFGG